MLETNIRYTLTSPAGTITHEGINQVLQFIQQQRLYNDDWKAQNPDANLSYLPALPETWDWVWVKTGRAEYVGTLPKRVSKFYYKQHGIRCPSNFLQLLGNIARQHTDDNHHYVFEFVNQFDWNAGEFGDHGSCYWGGRGAALEILAENGAYAIRFYGDDNQGIGRAWVVEVDSNLCIVFNGYGFAGHSTLVIARVMALHFGWTYKKIVVTNYGFTSGTVWINGGIGYAVGTPDEVDKIHEYDLEFGEANFCHNCGDAITEDEAYHGTDDEQYCESCYYSLFDDCSFCGATHWQDDLYHTNDGYVCDWCLGQHYARCERCDEYYRSNAGVAKEDSWYCESCYEDIREDE